MSCAAGYSPACPLFGAKLISELSFSWWYGSGNYLTRHQKESTEEDESIFAAWPICVSNQTFKKNTANNVGCEKMMIIRTSASLNKKIHVAPASSLPLSSNRYSDWSARLFAAGRAQYIVVTNTSSLYSVLLHGRGITDDNIFIQQTLAAICEQLAEEFPRIAVEGSKQ